MFNLYLVGMSISVLDVKAALLKYKKMCKGADFFGFGPDVFLNDLSVNVIVDVGIDNDKRIFICDLKTNGYPPKNFIGTYHILGGSWINPSHKTPFDVMKAELSEEIGNSNFVKTLVDNMYPFADYIISIPKTVHGNLRHQADFHITISSIFVSSITKSKLGNALDISLTGSRESIIKNLLSALKPVFIESKPGVFSFEDIIKGGGMRFCWGNNIILSDYLLEKYSVKVQVPGFDGIVADRLSSSPLIPYSERLETKHNRLNPIKRGLIEDSFSYESEKND